MQEKLSAVIICRNEEKTIDDCIKSVAWADEVVIIDAYSTDATVALCRKHTCRIVQRAWTNFREQRTFAIQQAHHPWILFLDADERVSPQLRDTITRILSSGDARDGYIIPRRTYYFGRLLRNWGKSYTLRLFKKANASMDPAKDIHETVLVQGATVRLKEYIDHYTYDDLSDYFNRFNTYTTSQAQQLFAAKQMGFLVVTVKMLLDPPYEIIRRLILKAGLCGGMPVFIMTVVSAFGKFVTLAKYWEIKQLNKKP